MQFERIFKCHKSCAGIALIDRAFIWLLIHYITEKITNSGTFFTAVQLKIN